MRIAVTRSLRSLRSGELIELRAPAEPAPSAVRFRRQPEEPAAPASASAGRRAGAWLWALIVLVLLAGCTRIEDHAAPTCAPKGADSLVLMAQSVPTASKIPCISSYPAGWHFQSMSVRNGEGRFTLDSDRAGFSAVKVYLQRSCDLEGATEIASDEPGTRRFERIISVVDDFRAVRSYSFDGGCITYRFDFDRQGRALVNEVSVAIGFLDRSAVDALVRQRSGGDLHL